MGFDQRSLQRIADTVRKTENAPFGGVPVSRGPARVDQSIIIKNSTDIDLPQWGVVFINGVDSSGLDYDTSENITFIGSKTTTWNPLTVAAILQHQINKGDSGRAIVRGITKAMVNVTDTAHYYAMPASGSNTNLSSSTSGFPIMAKKLTTAGTQVCVVFMGQDMNSSQLQVIQIASSAASGGGGLYPCYIVDTKTGSPNQGITHYAKFYGIASDADSVTLITLAGKNYLAIFEKDISPGVKQFGVYCNSLTDFYLQAGKLF